MKGFESILGQDGPIEILSRLLEKGKMPHAFLFTGIEGVGKRMTAKALAMAANCDASSDLKKHASEDHSGHYSADKDQRYPGGACGFCRSCKKILAGNHPDILSVEPSGPMIKIQQIRELIQTLALKPFEAKVRVVIIGQSHTMNPAAGNALLKVLEEPPDHTILILTAPQTADLLPTLVSRCRQIRFNPLSQQSICRLLETHHQMDTGPASVVAAMAGGSYTRAEAKSRSNWTRKREWLIFGGGFNHPGKMKKMSKQYLFAFTEKLAKNKETALESLDIIAGWLRDVAVFSFHPESIVNKDMESHIQRASKEKDSHGFFEMMSVVEQTKKDIQSNLNLRLSLDMMMLKLCGQHHP